MSRLTSGALMLGMVVAAALTLPGWLVVDIDQAWQVVPDEVPDALLLAVDRGLTPHEMLGVGTVLAVLCLGALACVVATQRSGRRFWLLVASVQLVIAAALAAVISTVLLIAELAVGTLLPDSWDRYDPDLVLAPWGPLFVVLTGVLSVGTGLAWLRVPRRTDPTPDATTTPT